MQLLFIIIIIIFACPTSEPLSYRSCSGTRVAGTARSVPPSQEGQAWVLHRGMANQGLWLGLGLGLWIEKGKEGRMVGEFFPVAVVIDSRVVAAMVTPLVLSSRCQLWYPVSDQQ